MLDGSYGILVNHSLICGSGSNSVEPTDGGLTELALSRPNRNAAVSAATILTSHSEWQRLWTCGGKMLVFTSILALARGFVIWPENGFFSGYKEFEIP